LGYGGAKKHSDFRLASKLASKLENLIFNQRAYARTVVAIIPAGEGVNGE
jgi:hypothetical protein